MPENVVVKETMGRGKGVFALKDFKENELILHVDGEVVETDNPASFPKEIQDHWFPFDKEGNRHSYVLPKAPWKYLNHSCNPNAGIKNNREIVAIRPIKAGEEVVFDYAMNNIDGWEMKCSCGSKNCRNLVSNFEALDEETKKKYLDYVIDCLKRQIK